MYSVTIRLSAGRRFNWNGWYRGNEWWRLRRWIGVHRTISTDPRTWWIGPWWVRVERVREE